MKNQAVIHSNYKTFKYQPETCFLMRKIAFALILAMVLFTSVALAEGNLTDPCANVVCNSPPADTCADAGKMRVYPAIGTCSNGLCAYNYTDKDCVTQTLTCPDGYIASCKGTCTNGVCGLCSPNCAGHESKCINVTCPPVTITCPDNSTASCKPGCDPNTGQCIACSPQCPTTVCAQVITYATDSAGNCKEFSNSCLPPGWTRVASCPTIQPLACKMLWWFDDTNKVCNQKEFCGTYMYYGLRTFDTKEQCASALGSTACPQLPTPACPPGKEPKKRFEGNCVVGYDCIEKECIKYTEPVCERGFTVSGGMDEFGCPRQRTCCGNGICESNENQMNCKEDCIGGTTCPINRQCPDGSTVSCRLDANTGCFCDQCPIQTQNIPPGCRQETDDKGFVRVICEATCQSQTDLQYAKVKCFRYNGTIAINKDARGCEYVDCQFGLVATQVQMASPISMQNVVCPSEDDLKSTEIKCKEMGSNALYVFDGGCKYVKCENIQEKIKCGLVPGPEREAIEKKCGEQGLGTIFNFDEQGCQHIACGSSQDCPKDPPKEAFEKCNNEGGELTVKRDQNGCVNYVNCIRRGDTRDTYVEKPTEIPDSSELLGLAFKLENLKIELDKLAKQADDIADYYKSVASSEEGKYRRVANMFETMKDKVDQIKAKLRDKLNSITIDDLMEVKQDIKYIKNVMINDVLYLMLSTGEDIKNLETKSESDCGSDSACFDRAFRLCQPVKFIPGDSKGTNVEVVGLEGDFCVLKARIPLSQGPPVGTVPGINPPYEMTCKVKNYALGIKNPQTDLIPYCEGALVKIMGYDKNKTESTLEKTPVSIQLVSQPSPSQSITLAFLFAFDSEGYGPGGCYKEDCVEYCTNRQQECMDYAEAQLKKNGGPGNTRSMQEVMDFCNKPENNAECITWIKPRTAFVLKYMTTFTAAERKIATLQQQRRYGPAVISGQDLTGNQWSGYEWYPEFEKSSCENCTSVWIDAGGEAVKGKITLEVIQGRGNVKIIQYPEEKNGFETKILFDDSPDGAGLYRIKILNEAGKAIFSFQDCIDGTDELIIKPNTAPRIGNNIKYQHISAKNPGEHPDCVNLLGNIIPPEKLQAQNYNYDSLAICLMEKGVKMYGVYWCDYCNRMKQIFGDKWKYIYVECANADQTRNDVCTRASTYPTWQFTGGSEIAPAGGTYVGQMTIEKISEYSGCSIQPRVSVSADDDPSIGPADVNIIIIEFGDYQCPYCKSVDSTVKQILEKYSNNVRFVYRDFPLTEIHQYAQKAAEASECADEQGKFWDYHDKLFENQQTLDTASLKQYAKNIGLNTANFDNCLDTGRMSAEVQKDLTDGKGYGVSGTPTFFINGIELAGTPGISAFEQIINNELR